MNQFYSSVFQSAANNRTFSFAAILIIGYLIYEAVDFSYKYTQSIARKKYDLLQDIREIYQSDNVYNYRIQVSNYTQSGEIAYVLIGVINREILKTPLDQLCVEGKISYNILLSSNKFFRFQRTNFTLYKGIKPTHNEDFIPNGRYNCYELNINQPKTRYPVVTKKMKLDINQNLVDSFFKKSGRPCYNLNAFLAYINAQNMIGSVDLLTTTTTQKNSIIQKNHNQNNQNKTGGVL